MEGVGSPTTASLTFLTAPLIEFAFLVGGGGAASAGALRLRSSTIVLINSQEYDKNFAQGKTDGN